MSTDGETGTSTSLSGFESTDEGSTAALESSTTDPNACAGWWDELWPRRQALSVASTGLDDPLSDAVVLLRLNANRIDYAETSPGGDDLRFILGNEVLAYDIERWDPNGESVVWLLVPTLAPGGATKLFMYYGNTTAQPGADPAATWAFYVSVHHLQTLDDSTGNQHHAFVSANDDPPTPATGHIAGGYAFDGDDEALTLPNEAAFDFTDAMTLEVLLRVNGFENDFEAIVTKGDDAWRLQRAGNAHTVSFGHDETNPSPPFNSLNLNLTGMTVVDDSAWHYVAATLDGTTKRLFVDGSLDAEAAVDGTIRQRDEPVKFAANANYNNSRFLEGILDEIRIARVARPPDYFAWQRNVLAEGVVTIGSVETCESP